jgi:hypothetical protein
MTIKQTEVGFYVLAEAKDHVTINGVIVPEKSNPKRLQTSILKNFVLLCSPIFDVCNIIK